MEGKSYTGICAGLAQVVIGQPFDTIKVNIQNKIRWRSLMFKDYYYLSSVNIELVQHFTKLADQIKHSRFVLDIGSNDGTCLKYFKQLGMTVLGIDPAVKIAEIANSNGINTIPDFFSSSVAEKIIIGHGKADLITSHNACAHIDDLDSVISGVSMLLKDDGVFIMEVGYFLDVFENKWFDTKDIVVLNKNKEFYIFTHKGYKRQLEDISSEYLEAFDRAMFQ